jgi:hypothetical protein
MNDALVIIIMAAFGVVCYAIGWFSGHKVGHLVGLRRGKAIANAR